MAVMAREVIGRTATEGPLRTPGGRPCSLGSSKLPEPTLDSVRLYRGSFFSGFEGVFSVLGLRCFGMLNPKP